MREGGKLLLRYAQGRTLWTPLLSGEDFSDVRAAALQFFAGLVEAREDLGVDGEVRGSAVVLAGMGDGGEPCRVDEEADGGFAVVLRGVLESTAGLAQVEAGDGWEACEDDRAAHGAG